MSAVKYEVVAVVGKNKKDDKPKWHKCGVIIETPKGLRMKLDAMPVFEPGSEGWFSLFEPKPKEAHSKPAAQTGDFDDDLSF